MAKPVIFNVDDDPEVLGAVERDLRQHYRADYRIMKAGSGQEALGAARELKRRGTAVALFLVDERMPGMSGTEFLREVLKIHPESRRVLLTAYADTQAAISGINDVGLDHYLLKPWDPPEERLYPVLDDLLSDWTANVRPPYQGIRVAGARTSPRSYAVKEYASGDTAAAHRATATGAPWTRADGGGRPVPHSYGTFGAIELPPRSCRVFRASDGIEVFTVRRTGW